MKLLSLLNIKPDSNQRWLLLSMAISGLLGTYSSPSLTKAIIMVLPAEWLAFESLVFSLATLLLGMIWQGRIRLAAMRYFLWFTIIESVCGCLLGLYLCFVDFNVWLFAIVSLIYTTMITGFVGKCIMAFKAKLWVEKEREVYDNNISIVSGIVCTCGYLCALVMLPSVEVSLFLWAVCCVFDDIGWIIVYSINKNKLENGD